VKKEVSDISSFCKTENESGEQFKGVTEEGEVNKDEIFEADSVVLLSCEEGSATTFLAEILFPDDNGLRTGKVKFDKEGKSFAETFEFSDVLKFFVLSVSSSLYSDSSDSSKKRFVKFHFQEKVSEVEVEETESFLLSFKKYEGEKYTAEEDNDV
jgi:hypothetical protein